MSHTPAAGVPMGTRPGDLDPGILIELATRHTPQELSDIVFHRSGLLALSAGESDEMAELVASTSEAARFAVEFYCRQVRGAIGAFAAKAGGLDGLVFTAGIGEHSARVRELVCGPLSCLGFALDQTANATHAAMLAAPGSKPILVVAADEEARVRALTERCAGAA